MPRDLPIGNGSLLINFDRDYQIRDIYYPKVGEVNHTLGHPSRFGVWVDGQFSWLGSSEWAKSLRYQDGTLVTHVTATNPKADIELIINDTVYCQKNILLRRITLKDLSGKTREVRLFVNHDLHISGIKGGDTAYYDPETESVIHYKRDRYFLINCLCSGMAGVKHYAAGINDFRETEGTWRDAEDGILSGDAIADGSVDSTIGIYLDLPADGEAKAYCWMTVGKSYDAVTRLNNLVIGETPEHLIERTTHYWKAWVKRGLDTSFIMPDMTISQNSSYLPENLVKLYERSLLILRTQIDNGGAITAANDFDPFEKGMDGYSYMWPRDGAMIAYALDEAGYREITERFFQFCADVIAPDGYFLHKYNPDGSVGSSWHPRIVNGKVQLPIQEDSTALVIWSFWHHFQKYQNLELARSLYEPLVLNAADFMLKYRDEATKLPLPSYDLWEERYGTHAFTTAAVCAGLSASANFADVFGDGQKADEFRNATGQMREAIDRYFYRHENKRFIRTLFSTSDGYQGDTTVDSSLYGMFAFGIYDVNDPKVVSTMHAVNKFLKIKTAIGGIARYENDPLLRISHDFSSVPGNPWIICTLWTAQFVIAKANTLTELSEALSILQWVAEHAFESGVLPEQINPITGEPLSVSPLAWSHSEFILTMVRFARKVYSLESNRLKEIKVS